MVTAIDVYHCPDKKLVFVQQRSPLIKGHVDQFVSDLSGWIRQSQFERVLLLSSANAAFRIDSELAGSQLGYACNPLCQHKSGMESILQEAGFIPLRTDEASWVNKHSFSSQLLDQMNQISIPAAAAVSMCYEGDNVPHAFGLARAVSQLLGLAEEAEWKAPPAWTHIQGEPLPRHLRTSGMY
eukprot:TRINITY_DN10775_c0_g1_i2.p1 TRINITY_DN10775_c0_g1~~TRINITY_DN10775_c0_g1_i2.p1  ORF type:complete len:183 (-),score=39.92 TRINITY_DN10775_c0_g1_i2:206-754(-)